MAIGVHSGDQHTYRHDLESFFWLLLYLCTYYPGPDKNPLTSRAKLVINDVEGKTIFQSIEQMDMAITADVKSMAVAKEGFKKTLARTHPKMREMFGDLLMGWRDILFPLDTIREMLVTGTPRDANDLYDRMLATLEQQIPAIKMKEENLQEWN